MKKKFSIYINAPITLTFTTICLLVLILGYITNGISTDILFSTYSASLLNPLTYLRLIFHVFGHVDFEHFISNAMYILLLGPMLEEKYNKKLIYILLITAVTTGLINNIFFPHTQLLGASGIVFAFILLSSITGREKGIPITLLLVTIFWIGGEIYDGLMYQDSISQITHIIGGAVGTFCGLFIKNN